MKHYLTTAAAIAMVLALGFAALPASAAEDEPIYGRQLMSPEEIAEHRAKMRSLETEQEREAYRQEHHERMQERAKQMGVTLPDEPQPRGRGMGRGSERGYGGGRGRGR